MDKAKRMGETSLLVGGDLAGVGAGLGMASAAVFLEINPLTEISLPVALTMQSYGIYMAVASGTNLKNDLLGTREPGPAEQLLGAAGKTPGNVGRVLDDFAGAVSLGLSGRGVFRSLSSGSGGLGVASDVSDFTRPPLRRDDN